MFRLNTSSSPALPTPKVLARIEEDPSMPVYYGRNQKGMQAEEAVDKET